MNRRILKATVALLGSVWLVVPARAQLLPAQDVIAEPWEVWYTNVPVSGGVRVGVMTGSGHSNVNPERFYVRLPEGDEGRVCVEISSRDGRYEAELAYDVPGPVSGVKPFTLPTAHRDKLSSYTAGDLSILAFRGASCDEEPQSFLVAAWSQVAVPDTVHIVINSPDPALLVGRGAESLSIACEVSASKVPSKAFNRECRVPVALLAGENALVIQQRTRVGRRVRIVPYQLPLRL